MQKVYELILDAANSDANIIIYGESGTGKELIARAIHEMSPRSEKPLVIVNCAAIPENLLESEFFGHSKGAFTGAHKDKQGHLDLADKGTLFLDEVGALNLSLQAKLLRAIEGGGYSPVGSNIAKNSDFRIIAATNTNLFEQTQKGLMRKDFFYRIHIIPINLPPLRRRKDDIPLLVEHFLRHYSGGKKIPLIPGQVLEALINYDWPGNVRELQNVIQRFLTVRRLEFLTDIEPGQMDIGYAGDNANGKYDNKTGLRRTVENVEKNVIKETLNLYKKNKSKTAEALGITRKTLSRKMKALGLL
jgi:transcriptional regulator with PAS, ATPase and Fis domain